MKTISIRRLAGTLSLAILLSTGSVGLAEEIALKGHTFTLPEGFTIEQVSTTELVERPITADFDELGNLYVADSAGSNDPVQQQLQNPTHRIVRLTDGDGRFDRQTVFADKVMFPEGTMWFDGSLYVAAPPSIWKFTDKDGDGVAEERVEWFQGKTLTGCANDLHGPYLGPDGWIYWCKGAFAEQTYDRPGKPPLVTKASHIFRARPDGSKIESVMTGGMDNPVDIAFLPTGDRILSNTFIQNPAGGYRDGLLHAVYGGLFGKVHGVLDGHPRTFPDVLPVLNHMGPAAPCGLHRLESAGWKEEFRNNLFACCFNLHKVTRHNLIPDGGTFRSETSDFVVSDNIDFHPTDVIEDADGSLLIVDTGGWYKLCCPTSQLSKPDVLGAIYRVRPVELKSVADPRGLELNWHEPPTDQLARRLIDDRPCVRSRARQCFSGRGETGIAALEALVQATSAAASEATWAASWIDHPAARAFVRKQLSHTDETVQRIALHVSGVWKDREAAQRVVELLKSGTPARRRAAAETLAQCGDEQSVPVLLQSLETVDALDWATVHAHTLALIEIGAVDATLAGLKSTNRGVLRSVLMAVEQTAPERLTASTILAVMQSPAVPLREAAQWVVARHPDWGPQLVEYFSSRLRTDYLPDDEQQRLVQQVASLTPSEDIQEMLADLLMDKTVGAAHRDRILQVFEFSAPKSVPTTWLKALEKMAALPDVSTQPLFKAVRGLAIKPEHAPRLIASLITTSRNNSLPAAIRLEALASLPGGVKELDDSLFQLARETAGADDPEARSWAMSVLTTSSHSGDQQRQLIELLADATPLELDRLVAVYKDTTDERLALSVLAKIESSRSFTSMRGDVLRAVFAKAGSDVGKELDRLANKLNADLERQRARLEQMLASLEGGDVRRGQLVFTSKKLACTTCHAIGYLGGKIGPDLTRIGQIRTERDLLEAILFPSASFVRSYEPLLIVTTEGLTHSGLVKRDAPDEVVLIAKPDQEIRIPRDQIDDIRPGTVSIMPAGLEQQLSAQELSDLVAFLRACK